jgi:formylglycine-generating enzyme required for sulfatase activity
LEAISDDSPIRVERGGSYFNVPVFCRSAERFDDAPRNGFDDLGLRLSRSIP